VTVRVLLEPPKNPIQPLRLRGGFLSRVRWLFLFVGLAAIGYSGYAYLDSHVYQAYEDWSFEQESVGKNPTVAGFFRDQVKLEPVASAKSEDSAIPDPSTTAAVPAGKKPADKVAEAKRDELPVSSIQRDPKMIGRIAIPRLKVKAIVREGVDDKTLRRAVGHVPETVRPGVPGNVGLAGHRDSFFRGLRNVRKDDRIVVETLDGKYEYVVESMKIVRPKDVHVLAPTKESILTLVTCYPFGYVGNAPKRYIVRAKQVSAEPLQASAEPTQAASKPLD
jgi:sortase A